MSQSGKFDKQLNSDFMEQIHISDATDENRLNGKVVDKVCLVRSNEHENNRFIITFMDGTYVAMCISEDTVSGDCTLKNAPPINAFKEIGRGIQVHDGNIMLSETLRKQKGIGVFKYDEDMLFVEVGKRLAEKIGLKYDEYIEAKKEHDRFQSHMQKNC